MKWVTAMLLLALTISAADKLSAEKVNTMVEALSRLDSAVVNGNERLKAALNQVLDATHGEPRFVGLVKKFGVKGREADLLVADYIFYLNDFRANPKAAEKLLAVGEKPRNPKLPAVKLAAYALVANTILNLDEAIMQN